MQDAQLICTTIKYKCSRGVRACLGGKLVRGHATGFHQKGPAAQKDKAEKPRSDIEGRHNACCQIKFVDYDAEYGTYDRSCD